MCEYGTWPELKSHYCDKTQDCVTSLLAPTLLMITHHRFLFIRSSNCITIFHVHRFCRGSWLWTDTRNKIICSFLKLVSLIYLIAQCLLKLKTLMWKQQNALFRSYNLSSPSTSLPHACNLNQLRVCIVNFWSLVSYNKHLKLYQLIETHKPDIIIGTETHLNKDIDSREIFPP